MGLTGNTSYVDMTTTLPGLNPPLQGGDTKTDSIDDLELPSLNPLQETPNSSLNPSSANETGGANINVNTSLNDIDIPFSLNELNELYKEVSPHTSHSK